MFDKTVAFSVIEVKRLVGSLKKDSKDAIDMYLHHLSDTLRY